MMELGGLITDEDELSLPVAPVNKLIKEAVPNHRVSKEARQLVVDCCTQFIHKMATTSSERCENAAKKTIAPDHVLEALEILGFPEMVPDCRAVLEECRINQQKRRKGSNRLEDAGLSLEELHKQQQRLIDEAKQQQYLEEQQEYQQLHFNHLNMRPPNEDDDEDFDS